MATVGERLSDQRDRDDREEVCPNLQQAEPGKGPIRQRSLPLVVEERVGEREPDSG
jgi:hypothetical protein